MTFENKSDKKGFGFEYEVSGMFQSQGYLARRGVPLQYGLTNHDATDIDVLGIIFTNPFQGHRIICDCKNKARSKPYERIFWAKGLGDFVKASSVFVALNKTQWEIIRFAASGGVKVLTSEILNDYRKTQLSYGLADSAFYESYENKLIKAAKSDVLIGNITTNTKKLYLHEDPYVAINICLEFLRSIAQNLDLAIKRNKDHHDSLKYLACELTVLVGLQVLWICSDVLGLPEKARRDHIASKLTYGELEPKMVKSIMDTARELANESIKASVPKSVAPKYVDFGEITSPPYTPSLIGIIERALARPEIYLTMPQHLDFLLFEQGIKGRDYSDEELTAIFGYGSSDERFKVARNIVSFVRESCSLDWKSMWGKVDKPKPTQAPPVQSNINSGVGDTPTEPDKKLGEDTEKVSQSPVGNKPEQISMDE